MRNHLCTSKGWHSLKITWILQRKGGKSEAFRSRTEVPRGAPQDCVPGTKGGDDKIRFKLRTRATKVALVFQVWFFAWYNNFKYFCLCTYLSVYPLAVFLVAIRSQERGAFEPGWQQSSNNRKCPQENEAVTAVLNWNEHDFTPNGRDNDAVTAITSRQGSFGNPYVSAVFCAVPVIYLEDTEALRALLKSTLHDDLQLCTDAMREVKHVLL